MDNNAINNKRIAKNTFVLYLRTLVILIVSLYTSRVILNVLGVDDYGIYNAVGGVVAMFSVISGALSAAISRFLTFELGKGDINRLKTIFSTSINIQIGIAILILLVGEFLGVWFLNTQMNIPPERITAANWVLQCSLFTFCVNLVTTPFNACVIAHERMDVFAYISIFEALLKLAICYAITVSAWDKLIVYSILLLAVALVICFIYSLFCHRKFEESKYSFVFDKPILKEMTSFAGWNFFTNSAYVFNTQGVNLLINIFFGVAVNAARGIATQVESAVLQLVNSFTTALNPQITKNYASGDYDAMMSLVFKGAKFSYYLLFIVALPIILEADFLLDIWLKIVPDHAVAFVQLAMIASLVNIIGKTGYTAAMATGRIKRYVLWVTLSGLLAFPLSWLAFAFGAPVEATYIIFIIVYVVVEGVRLWILKDLMSFPVKTFIYEVIFRILLVTVISIILPIIVINVWDTSWLRFIITISVCVICTIVTIYFIGLTANEKLMIKELIKKRICRK